MQLGIICLILFRDIPILLKNYSFFTFTSSVAVPQCRPMPRFCNPVSYRKLIPQMAVGHQLTTKKVEKSSIKAKSCLYADVLYLALLGHGGCRSGSGFFIAQVIVPDGLEVLVQLIHQWNAIGNVQADDVFFRNIIQIFDQRGICCQWAAISTRFPA